MSLDADPRSTLGPSKGFAVVVASLLAFSALLVVANAPRPSSESQSPIYTITTSAGGRDPYTWPFSRDSIWNLPIGANAAYVPGNIVRASQMAMFDEADVLILKPNAPITAVYKNTDGWGAGNRCAPTLPITTLFSAPIPSNFVVPGSHSGDPHGETPNYAAAILSSDNHTLYQGQPMARCSGLNPTMWWYQSAEDLYGTGFSGAHGGSMLSSIGGTVRLGELVPGGIIRHAMKVNLYGVENYWYDSTTHGYRWPATTADSGAANNYHGSTPALRMGSLLALLPGFNINSLETEPGRILAHAFQDYGSYTVDDSAWSVYMIATEFSPDGDVMTQFQQNWSYPLNVGANANTPWSRDLQTIFSALQVIDNWDATLWNTVRASNGTQGAGGGAPRVSWAPPFGSGQVATRLVMGATSPDPSIVGQMVSFSAVLTRTDNGGALSGKSIAFQASDDNGATWWSAGTYVTDANGRASGGTVFTSPGSKLVRALFAGDTGYSGSMSGNEPHTVTG